MVLNVTVHGPHGGFNAASQYMSTNLHRPYSSQKRADLDDVAQFVGHHPMH